MERSEQWQKRSESQGPASSSPESFDALSSAAHSPNLDAMTHYTSYSQPLYGMAGPPESTGTTGRLTVNGLTEEELYAMTEMDTSGIAFQESMPSTSSTTQPIGIASGYEHLPLGNYIPPSSSNMHANEYAAGSLGSQYLAESSAFQTWGHEIGHQSLSSASGAVPWDESNAAMYTTADFCSSSHGVSPSQYQDVPDSSSSQQEGTFRCDIEGCGKLFTRSYNYKAHLETHDERREYPFHCQVDGCDKKFARKTDLQRHHQSVHMKERNHGCTLCGRFFARKDTLRRHMEDGCSKRFDIETIDLNHTVG